MTELVQITRQAEQRIALLLGVKPGEMIPNSIIIEEYLTATGERHSTVRWQCERTMPHETEMQLAYIINRYSTKETR